MAKRRKVRRSSPKRRRTSYRSSSRGKKRPLVNLKAFCGLIFAIALIFVFSRVPVSMRSIVPECNELFKKVETQLTLRKGVLSEISKSFEVKTFLGTKYREGTYSVKLYSGVAPDKFWYGIEQALPQGYSVIKKNRRSMYSVRVQYDKLTVAIIDLLPSGHAPPQLKKSVRKAEPVQTKEQSRKKIVKAKKNVSVDKKKTVSTSEKMIVQKPRIVQGKVAIVIDDVGNTRAHEESFFKLPRQITPAILPQLTFSEYFAHKANARGHDVMLHLPMEPENKNVNPGPGVITVDMSRDQIRSIMNANFYTVPYAVGVNNHMGSLCTQDEAIMNTVLGELKQRRLYFLDSYTSRGSVVYQVMYELNMPYSKRDVFLDNEDDTGYIKGQIRELIAVAKKNSFAIGIGHYRANTFRAISEMIPVFDQEGIELVKVRELI